MATKPKDPQQPLERRATHAWETRRAFSLFGFRILIQTPHQRSDCEQCGGSGFWRPPYRLEREPCDLCTSAPISAASATTSDGAGLPPSKA